MWVTWGEYVVVFDALVADCLINNANYFQLQHESVAFRFAKKVFPTDFSFIAVIEQSSKVRISAKAPPKRSQTRNFVQGDTQSSRLVYKRVSRNISAFETEIQGTSYTKPESQSLLSWHYITGDTDGLWINLWDGVAATLVVKDEPMKHRATFCNDASFSWLETDTIMLEVCGLKNMGTSFSDPGLQLAGVANVQLNGSRGGVPLGLVQSVTSQFVYMPHMSNASEDRFDLAMNDFSNKLSSDAEEIRLSTAKRDPRVVAGEIEAIVPFNHSTIVTLTGFAFFEPLDSFVITTMPSHMLLKQYDGSMLETSRKTVTDGENRIQIHIPDFAAGFNYDSFQYSVKALGSSSSNSAKMTVHVLCRSATYYNSTLRKCFPCPAGTFNTKMALSSSCEKCLPGTDSQPGSTACVPCPIGYFAPQGALCSKCPPGTYSPKPGLEACMECAQGTFSFMSAASSCFECGNIAYADENRSSLCKSCPKSTASNSKTSTSILDCRCIEGYYEPKGDVGKECLECPDGAYCHGNRYPPVTRQHFWTSQEEWMSIEEPKYFICDHRGVRNTCRGFPELNRVESMARCAHRSVKGLCDVYPVFPTLIYGNASAIDDRVCSRGYTGRICSNCRENYYKYGGGTCIECPSPVVVLLIAAVVVIIFVLIAEASASPVLTIFISTSNLQNLALLSRFGIPHPPILAEIWNILAVFNTNFELIPFQCIMGSAFEWEATWSFEVFTLALIFIICVGRWIIPYFMYRPLLRENVHRALTQHRPTSAIPVNRHTSYRPSRPSTPSSQNSNNGGMIQINELATAAKIVVEDLSDGAPSIEAGVFEDDSESVALDAEKIANHSTQRGKLRLTPSIHEKVPKSKNARTGLVSAHSAASTTASSVDLQQWQGLSQDELDFYLDSAIWIGCFVLDHFFYFSSLVTFQAFACRYQSFEWLH